MLSNTLLVRQRPSATESRLSAGKHLFLDKLLDAGSSWITSWLYFYRPSSVECISFWSAPLCALVCLLLEYFFFFFFNIIFLFLFCFSFHFLILVAWYRTWFLFLDISLLSDLTFTFLWALEHTLGLHSIANDVVGNGCMRPVERANWRHICPSGLDRVVCMFNGTCKWRHVHIIIITRVRLRRFSSLLLCFLIGCRLGAWCTAGCYWTLCCFPLPWGIHIFLFSSHIRRTLTIQACKARTNHKSFHWLVSLDSSLALNPFTDLKSDSFC